MIHTGDCLEVMAGMPAESVDAVVTDPPYGLEFMGRTWDRLGDIGQASSGLNKPDPGPWGRQQRVQYNGSANKKCRRCNKWAWAKDKCVCEVPDFPNVEAHQGRLMQEWHHRWATEALRVTKPGGYLLAFGGTRTHHRLVCGLEDAGWIIRDELDWIYASGFPKGKANLKPAHEPIVLARKPGPLRALAIDECRIGAPPKERGGTRERVRGYVGIKSEEVVPANPPNEAGRWPSNLLLSDPELFDEPNPYVVGSGATVSSGLMKAGTIEGGKSVARNDMPGREMVRDTYADSGGYSRFFIIPKADRADREPIGYNGAARVNVHPTTKPTDLMRHLIRLVTPAGGLVLDPFLGSGTTAVAAELEGFPWIGIEKEPEYVAIAEARLNGTQRGLGLDVSAPVKAPPKTHPDLSKHQPKRRAPADNWTGGWVGTGMSPSPGHLGLLGGHDDR